jgi:cation transport ATPase
MRAAAPTLPAPTDRGALGWLVASNAVTLVLALWQGWSLGLLLWPYWAQSVIIGVFSYRRMLGLQRFSTANFRVNGKPAEENDATRRSTANFFAMHYGMFHLVYAIFLLMLTTPAADWLWIAIAVVAFAFNHASSFRRFREADRQGRPNIGALMFLPYLRVLPMHLMIIFGIGMAGGGAVAVLFFGLLKTAADAAMHVAEHRILASARAV